MNKGLLPVLAVATISSLAYFINQYGKKTVKTIPRSQLVQIIIGLRKTIFSTLREVAYAANFMRVTESDLEPRKIKDILMRDGGETCSYLQLLPKSNSMPFNVLCWAGFKQQAFEHSCNYYSHFDVQVKMLLQAFKNDIQLAIDGTVQSYHGPLPRLTRHQVIIMYREVTLRRMRVIEDKFINGIDHEQCIKREHQIQQYLEAEGIHHPREASQKIFQAILEEYYKSDSQFKEEFEMLELEFVQFIDEVKKKTNKQQPMGDKG